MQDTLDRDQALDWVLKVAAARKPLPKPGVLQPTAAEKKQELKGKQSKELQLWHEYKASGWKPEKLDPLIKSLQPLLNQSISKWTRAEIPTSFTEHVHKRELVKILKTFDPAKAALNTHILKRLPKTSRPLTAVQTFAYSPENITKNIGAYNAFKADIRERLGHEPDDQTILDFAIKEKHPKLGALTIKDVKRLNKEQRKGLITSGFETDLILSGEVDPREVEVAHLILPQLTSEERIVHEYTLGLNGKPRLKPGEIAKKIKMDGTKVAKLRSAVWNKMKPYLND